MKSRTVGITECQDTGQQATWCQVVRSLKAWKTVMKVK